MVDAPSGWEDARADLSPEPVRVSVAGLRVQTVVPPPGVLLHVADALSAESSVDARQRGTFGCIRGCLTPQGFTQVADRLADPEASSPSSVADARDALLTAHTGRPLQAVGVLAVSAVASWRVLRARAAAWGVPDLAGLPSLHVLLDVAEAVFREGRDKDQQERLDAQLYRPALGSGRAHFTQSEADAAFDAFMSANGG